MQEALDSDVVTIASDVAGNRLSLQNGDFGTLFPCGNAATLANSIEHAIANRELLQRKASDGRIALHARYGASAFWSSLNAELRNVAGGIQPTVKTRPVIRWVSQ